MTTQHEAMRAALEALGYRLSGDPDPHIPEARAIELLRTAIAATPDAQPVAWQMRNNLGGQWSAWTQCEPLDPSEPREALIGGRVVYQWRPVYVAPLAPATPPSTALEYITGYSDGPAWARGVNAQVVEALRAAEEYIAQHSQANGYGLLDHDHDRYERLPLLERLSAAISAAEAAQKGTT